MKVHYAKLITRELTYRVGSGDITSIEREAGTTIYEVHYKDGTLDTIPSQRIMDVELTHEDYERLMK